MSQSQRLENKISTIEIPLDSRTSKTLLCLVIVDLLKKSYWLSLFCFFLIVIFGCPYFHKTSLSNKQTTNQPTIFLLLSLSSWLFPPISALSENTLFLLFFFLSSFSLLTSSLSKVISSLTLCYFVSSTLINLLVKFSILMN